MVEGKGIRGADVSDVSDVDEIVVVLRQMEIRNK